MDRYGVEALRAFLQEIDAVLEEPCSVILVGGAAVALAWNPRFATRDIDTYESDEPAFREAVATLRDRPGSIPVHPVTVGDAPYHYPDRLLRLDLPGATRLTARRPEAHDLVVMKALRASEHDLEAIEAIHQIEGLRLETPLVRIQETSHSIGDPGRLKANLLLTIERLFGEAAADAAEQALATWARVPR